MLTLSPPERAQSASFFLGGFTWTAQFSAAGLRELNIVEGKERSSAGRDVSDRMKKLRDAIEARVAGGREGLSWEDFDLSGRAPFHLRIWKEMFAIPFGETRSYAEVARAVGSPLAFRACGQACGANPILLFIPCHRVIGSAGLGGFGRGLDFKKRMLGWEGVDWKTLGKSSRT